MNTLEELEAFARTPWQERFPETSSYEIIGNTAQRYPDAHAIKFLFSGAIDEEPVCISYQHFLENINATANALHSLGLPVGAVTSLVLPNLPQTLYSLYGAQALGIAGPINPLLEPDALSDILVASETQALVCLGPMPGSDIWEKLISIVNDVHSLKVIMQVNPLGKPSSDSPDQTTPGGIPIVDYEESITGSERARLVFPRQIRPSDIATYFHTGGTTSTPKLAQHSHANQVFMAGSIGAINQLDENIVGLAGLPLFHVNAAFLTGLNIFRVGGCVVYATPGGYRTPAVIENLWRLIEKYQVNYFSAVPTLLATLLSVPIDGADVGSLRFVVCGAAPLSTGLFRKFKATTGVEIVEGYGLTEGTCTSSANPVEGEKRIGSIGLPMPYQSIRTVLLDEHGNYLRDCEVNEIGELLIQGPNVFAGYKQEEANKHAFIEDWLITGDLARIDADGYIWLTGRAKDLIIRGGHNIDPNSIEQCLGKHPKVEVAAAVGQPDAHAGELPCAYVTAKADATIEAGELEAYCAQEISERAAVPVHIEIREDLPLTAVGKVFKPQLRRDAIARVYQSTLGEHDIQASFEVIEDKALGTVVAFKSVDQPQKARELLAAFPFTVRGCE